MFEINNPNHGGPNHNIVGTGIKVIGNKFAGNGWKYPNAVMYGAAIEVSATSRVEIASNLIAPNNYHAITFTQTARTDYSGEDLTVHDINVHDNDIGLRTSGSNLFTDIGRVGFYSGTPNPPTPTSMNFANNRYYFDDSGAVHFSLARIGNQTDPYRLAKLSAVARGGLRQHEHPARECRVSVRWPNATPVTISVSESERVPIPFAEREFFSVTDSRRRRNAIARRGLRFWRGYGGDGCGCLRERQRRRHQRGHVDNLGQVWKGPRVRRNHIPCVGPRFRIVASDDGRHARGLGESNRRNHGVERRDL